MADTGVNADQTDGLRDFIERCRAEGEVQEIDGADWHLEIQTLTEAVSETVKEPPAILFDNIKGYPAGFRVFSLPMASRKRVAITLGLPIDLPMQELMKTASRKVRGAKPIPPVTVASGPVMENVMTGDDVDLGIFPVLFSHENDGGRYIGTGDTVIMADPDSDFINMGTYRMQLHDSRTLGLWCSPGQQGRRLREAWWARGKACPVVATFGGDPLVFMAAHTRLPWGACELDLVGGLRGAPLQVIKGPLTGLPIPAHAEIAIEGEVPPPSEELRAEGPFGEWPGYYSGGTLGTGEDQPVIRVKAIYYRNNPILLNMAPQWPGAPHHGLRLSAGLLADQLNAAGVPGVEGVFVYHQFLVAISIRQQYAGHARQTGMAALGCAANAYLGRYVVIVDEDIDPSNLNEVLWAMETRVDPARDIQIVDGTWAGPLDPRMPPDQKERREHTNARAVFYAVRPWQWRDQFPMVNRAGREAMREAMRKFRSDRLPFPNV